MALAIMKPVSTLTGSRSVRLKQPAIRFITPLSGNPCAPRNGSSTLPSGLGCKRAAPGLQLDVCGWRSTTSCNNSWRGQDPNTGGDDETMNNVLSVGIAVLWVCLGTYAFGFSPNQTPYRDIIFIKLLTGISQDSTFSVNPVYFSVFNIIGLYTFFYQSLLIPGGRSANKIPAWPFVVLGYGFGAFALLPYMALWRPDRELELPLPKKDLEGWDKLAMKGAETKILPAITLVAGAYLVYNAATAGGAAWFGFLNLFDESRLVHISTIDCCILATLAPFWMSNDAELRDWKDREQLLPILSFLPVIGPAVYLILRPKTGENDP